MSQGEGERIGAVLVLGGGVAGVQAALDLAESGYKVFLVERESSVGGLATSLCCKGLIECKDCFLCPASKGIFRAISHPRIEILRSSEVLRVKGIPGSFTVRISRKESSKRNCPICKSLPIYSPGFYPEPREEELSVGSIILAGGFGSFDPMRKAEYGYKRFENSLSSLDLEKMIRAQSSIRRPSDGKEPHRIAFIQCVGSRDKRRGREYCSAVCCTFAIKEAITIKELLKGTEATIFFYDLRPSGKDPEKYYAKAQEYGIKFIRAGVSGIEETEEATLRVHYVDIQGDHRTSEFDMVILSSGFEPPDGIKGLSDILEIEVNEYGFCATKEFSPLNTSKEGIFVCGTLSGPKDFPETAMEASGAAASSSGLLVPARNTLIEEKAYPLERDVSEEEPKIGVFVCRCGSLISEAVDTAKIRRFAGGLPGVVMALEEEYLCSPDGRKRLKEKIKEHEFNRVVIAGCSPRFHELLFQECLREAGLNPYLLEMANICEQCSWVHCEDREKATSKAKGLVKMAVAKARLLKPLKPVTASLTRAGLVIGGGISGLVSSLGLARQGFEVHLVEREPQLGGIARRIHHTLDGEGVQAYLQGLIKEVLENPLIQVYTSCEISEVTGSVGNFVTKLIGKGGEEKEIRHGVTIIATGAEEYKPEEYLYGKDPRVMTLLELDERIAQDDTMVRGSQKNIVFIQCVGSRNEERAYCSKVCCGQAIKCALKIKEINPAANIYILYRDMRTYGFMEHFYGKAREQGVIFIRYELENKPRAELVTEGDREVLRVTVKDLILGENLVIDADILGLGVAVIARSDNEKLAQLFNVPLKEEGFFLEDSTKISTVETIADGVFLAGLAQWPKFIRESIIQAKAASSKAATILSKDQVFGEAIISTTNEAICSGCGICVSICPYSARMIDKEQKIAKVNETLCKGCGACSAVCPSKAAELKRYNSIEISAVLSAALEGGRE